MCEIGTMEVFQTLSCPIQLSLHVSEGGCGKCEATCQFQSVDMILSNEFHNVSVRHPLRNSDELPFLHVSLNASKLQDVGMGQRIPENDFLAKSL